jgi:Cft2 family RNA processing exonuclease
MTLIELESGRRILVDINIRAAADDPEDDTPDVASQLRDRLKRDQAGRLYVDAFLLTHPDADHIRGLKNHFHLGAPNTWSKASDKIIIREMWSSPIVFRRASRNHVLCDDVNDWAAEARRRVRLHQDTGRGYRREDRRSGNHSGEDRRDVLDDLQQMGRIVRSAPARSSPRDG